MARAKSFTEKYKVNIVREFQGCGLTAREFCKQTGLAGSTFSVWRKRLASLSKLQPTPQAARRQKSKSDQGLDFVPVTIIETKSISSAPPRSRPPRLPGHHGRGDGPAIRRVD